MQKGIHLLLIKMRRDIYFLNGLIITDIRIQNQTDENQVMNGY